LANGDVIIDHQDIRSLIDKTGNVLSIIELQDVAGLGVIEVKGDRITNLFEKAENRLLIWLTPVYICLRRTYLKPSK